MGAGLEDLLPLFLSESDRILGEMNASAEALIQNPEDTTARDTLCRGAHTLKGSAAVMGMTEISDFVGAVERLLGCFYGDPKPYTTELHAQVQEALTLTGQLVEEVHQSENQEKIADRARIAHLTEASS